MSGDVVVLGLGNVLRGDDAIGPWVVRELLARHEFPPDVRVVDAGTPGVDLSPWLAGAGAAIFVDAVRGPGAGGDLVLERRDEILRRPSPRGMGTHAGGIGETLRLLALTSEAPVNVVLIGVVGTEFAQGAPLSPVVRAAIPRAAAAVIEELARLGRSTTPRERGAEAFPP